MLLQNERLQKTTLTEFFTKNGEAATAAANGQQLNFDCRELLYQEFRIHMTWDNKHHRWKLRRNRPANIIGPMYFVGPRSGERFYLRLLLTIVKGSISFEDLRTWDGVVHPTFKMD